MGWLVQDSVDAWRDFRSKSKRWQFLMAALLVFLVAAFLIAANSPCALEGLSPPEGAPPNAG